MECILQFRGATWLTEKCIIRWYAIILLQSAYFKVNLEKTLFYLNETDGIIGVSETAFWLSTCCNEDPDSCYAQTGEKVITISAGSKF